MKKKVLWIVVVCLLVVGAVLVPFFGNVGHVRLRMEDSQMHSQREIRHCANLVKWYFFSNFHGAELLEIRYDEEFNRRFGEAEAAGIGGEEAIILHSDWIGGRWDVAGAGEEYGDWKWIFVKSPLGIWEMTGNGYG